MSTEIKLTVSEIQRFCMHDGPGVRTTVFLKGCPLRCEWCHNPETQKRERELLFYSSKCIGCRLCESTCDRGAHSFDGEHTLDRGKCASCGRCAEICPTCALELCGREYTVSELLSVIEKDSAFYGDFGGVTLSGGEPLMQGRAAVELLRACKEHGFSTAVESCGYADAETVIAALPYTDLFLWDVKDTADSRHRKYTGASNKKILDNLALADAHGARVRLRCILVNGVNTDETHYRGIVETAKSLSNCEGVEFIRYHAYAGTKATFLGLRDNGRPEWIPTDKQVGDAKEFLRLRGVRVI